MPQQPRRLGRAAQAQSCIGPHSLLRDDGIADELEALGQLLVEHVRVRAGERAQGSRQSLLISSKVHAPRRQRRRRPLTGTRCPKVPVLGLRC
eukprot:gene14500-biopygen10036